MKRTGLLLFFCFLSAGLFSQQVLDWTSLPQEVNTDVYDLNVYNGKLVASGMFVKAGNVQARKIAAWDGSNWANFGNGLGGSLAVCYRTLVWNNDLYAAGMFDSAGTAKAKNIAKWNGFTWTNLGAGSNKSIYSIAVYNNEIYVGGLFDTIGGIAASHVAKWDGTSWQALGTGIQGNNINDLCVFQNELYAVGVFNSAGGIPCNYIAKWDGLNWSSVGAGVGYGNSSLIQWRGKLLVGSDIPNTPPSYPSVKEWNGIGWNTFSSQPMFAIRKFLNYNNQLYCSGVTGIPPAGSSNVAVWDSVINQWKVVGAGVGGYLPALCGFNGELYCGGDFNKTQGAYHNYIAKLADVTAVETLNLDNLIKYYPNPVRNELNIEFKGFLGLPLDYSILNVIGQKLFDLSVVNKQKVDMSKLESGIYFLEIKSGVMQKTIKLIKE